jgi:GNAT superfamily N-acetyltransferase
LPSSYLIAELISLTNPDDISALCEVLMDCVEGGASVSFMQPLTLAKAEDFWSGVGKSIALGERALIVARDSENHIVGTVQVILRQPENQPHRADISKLLVHRSARRHGLAAQLMAVAELAAKAAGKRVLVLDTATGGGAEKLYERLGWQLCGRIPDYALWPSGGLCATTIYYKHLKENEMISIAFESPDQTDVIALIAELDVYQSGLYPPESHHALDLTSVAAKQVLFAVARENGIAVACGAVVLNEEYGEIKRMYVRPAHRGQSLAKKLLTMLESAAKKAACHRLKLETGPYQPEALALYAMFGYERCGPFGDYTNDPLSVFMQKTL